MRCSQGVTSHTAESARAALALGPVQAVCNVCSKRHKFSQGGNITRQAVQCRYARAGNGIALAYQSYSAELVAIWRLLQGIDSYLRTEWRAVPGNQAARFGEVESRLKLLNVFASLALQAQTVSPEALWRYQDEFKHHPKKPFSAIDVICPWSHASSWILIPDSGEANLQIARIYLVELCADRFWGEVRELLLQSGLTRMGERYAVAQYDEASMIAASIAFRAGLRQGEGSA